MTANRRSTIALAALMALGLLGTAGACGAVGDPAETIDTRTPSPDPSPSPSISPTAASPTTPPSVAIDCDSIIPTSRQDFFATSGLSLTPPADFFAKVASEGQPSPFNLFQANGGVVCAWGNGSEVVWAYGYTPLPPEQGANAGSLIQNSDPFTVSDYAGGTLYTSGIEGSAFTYFLVIESSFFVASTTEILDEMMVAVP